MQMKIVMKPINEILPYPGNPRINEAAVGPVSESIRQYGFKNPILVDQEGVIIAGHTRLLAAKKLGLTEVPVICADDLTPQQVRAFRIADNRLHELSKWDYELLPIELKELQDMDFDLGLLGFDEEELGELLAPAVQEGLTDEDAVPNPPKVATTKPGDLYLLGGKVKCPKCGKENQL